MDATVIYVLREQPVDAPVEKETAAQLEHTEQSPNPLRATLRKGSTNDAKNYLKKRFLKKTNSSEAPKEMAIVAKEAAEVRMKRNSLIAESSKIGNAASVNLNSGELLLKNGTLPEGFSSSAYKVRSGSLPGLVYHLTNEQSCGYSFYFILK